jgi:hypothetical protein
VNGHMVVNHTNSPKMPYVDDHPAAELNTEYLGRVSQGRESSERCDTDYKLVIDLGEATLGLRCS